MNKKDLFLIFGFTVLILLSGCTSIQITPKPMPELTNKTNATNSSLEKNMTSFSLDYETLTIDYLDIDGESYLVSYHGYNMLIDTGKSTDSSKIISKLKSLGIDRLNAIVVTNNAPNRAGSVVYLWLRFKPDNVYDNGLISGSDYELINATHIKEDTTIYLKDNLSMQLIVPYDAGYGFQSGVGKDSIMVRLIGLKANVLFASNCDSQCYNWTSDANIEADVLFPSSYNTLQTLRRIRPLKVFSNEEIFKNLNYDIYSKGQTVLIKDKIKVI